jgi:hypothetical protein
VGKKKISESSSPFSVDFNGQKSRRREERSRRAAAAGGLACTAVLLTWKIVKDGLSAGTDRSFFSFLYSKETKERGEQSGQAPLFRWGDWELFFGGGEQKNDKAQQQQQQRLLIPNDYENEINGYCSRLQYIILFFLKKGRARE